MDSLLFLTMVYIFLLWELVERYFIWEKFVGKEVFHDTQVWRDEGCLFFHGVRLHVAGVVTGVKEGYQD